MSERFPYAHDLMHPEIIDGCEICDDRKRALKELGELSVDPHSLDRSAFGDEELAKMWFGDE